MCFETCDLSYMRFNYRKRNSYTQSLYTVEPVDIYMSKVQLKVWIKQKKK